MLLDPVQCTLCLFEARLRQVQKFCPEDRRRHCVESIIRKVSELGLTSRTRLFQETYRIIVETCCSVDPYAEDKRALREIFRGALSLDAEDLATLLSLSAAGNMLDVEMREHRVSFQEVYAKLRSAQVVFYPSLHSVLELIEKARRVVIALDNVGEHFLDLTLASHLVRMGKDIVLVARRVPYEIDVTCDELRRDVETLGLEDKLAIVESEGPSVLRALDLAEDNSVVISKGIANFEAYLDQGDRTKQVLFLLAAKCSVLARVFGVNVGTPVVVTSQYVNSLFK